MRKLLITGANGQLGNEIRTISSEFQDYQYLFTSHDELPLENLNALKSYFQKKQNRLLY